MTKIKCTKITFEALGRVEVTYCQFFDVDYVNYYIRLISPTAHFVDAELVTINKATFEENNLEKIKIFSDSIKY